MVAESAWFFGMLVLLINLNNANFESTNISILNSCVYGSMIRNQ